MGINRPGSILVLDSYGDITGAGGTFIYLMDEHREINCNMNFENYPMDEQVCSFKIFSAIYTLDELVSYLLLKWKI